MNNVKNIECLYISFSQKYNEPHRDFLMLIIFLHILIYFNIIVLYNSVKIYEGKQIVLKSNFYRQPLNIIKK